MALRNGLIQSRADFARARDFLNRLSAPTALSQTERASWPDDTAQVALFGLPGSWRWLDVCQASQGHVRECQHSRWTHVNPQKRACNACANHCPVVEAAPLS